jgi:hypothetical protein
MNAREVKAKVISNAGYEVVWKDWDRSFSK